MLFKSVVCGVVWCGGVGLVVWCGGGAVLALRWCGVWFGVWCGVVWCGVGVVWCGVV